MSPTTSLIVATMIVAVIGWLATVHWLQTREWMSQKIKRMLIVPAWFPWMGAALGIPVVRGDMSTGEAGKAILGLVLGMGVFLINSRHING